MAALLTMLGTALPTSAQNKQKQDALYIYRNDGGFNGFFYGEIDRFEYSKVDTFGVEHDDFVVQEIWARDTVFRIPINAIDSIGFVTPENIYKEDVAVTNESDLWNYVIKSDTLYSFTLASNTPAAIIPKVGDKIAKPSKTTNLPYGIFGHVTAIETQTDGITVVCEQIPVAELYEQYTGKSVYEAYPPDEANNTQQVPTRGWDWDNWGVEVNEPDIRKDLHYPIVWKGVTDLVDFLKAALTYSPSDDYSIQIEGKLNGWADESVKLRIVAFYHNSLMLGEQIDIYTSALVTHKSEISADVNISANVDMPFHEKVKVYIPDTPLFNTYQFGVFINVAGDVMYTSGSVRKQRYNIHFTYDNPYESLSTALFKYITPQNYFLDAVARTRLSLTTVPIENESYSSVGVTGTYQGGIFLNIGLDMLSDDLLTVYSRGELGIKVSGKIPYDFDNSQKSLPSYLDSQPSEKYNTLISLGSSSQSEYYLSGKFGFGIGPKKWKLGRTFEPLYLKLTSRQYSYVPSFDNLEASIDKDGKHINASVDISGTCSSPTTYAGFAVYDLKTWKLLSYREYEREYFDKISGKSLFKNYKMSIPYNGEIGTRVRVYPTVNTTYYGRMLASMYYDIDIKFSMKLTPEELSFKAAGGTQSVTIEHNGNASKFNVGVSTTDEDKEWCTAKLSDNKITVKAAKNKKMKERYATITVTYGEGADKVVKEIKVTQEAADEDEIPAANNANDLWYTFRHSSSQDASYYVLMTFGKDGSYEWNYYTPKGLSSWERGTYEVISSKPNSTVEVIYNSYVPETVEVGKWINKTGVGWFGEKEKWTNVNYYRLKITYVTASNVQKTKEIEVYANSSNKVLNIEWTGEVKIPRIWYEECVWWDIDNLIGLIYNIQ
jgi:hypothetical protein